MTKKRVLCCNEASYLSTGYSRYGLEVLSRLYNTQKFEIAELGCYGSHGDERRSRIPWPIFSNLPFNEAEQKAYDSDLANQFGQWRFESVCLQFKPDVVISFRDYWMDSFIEHSIFRPFYKHIWMPTCDSSPQDERWVADFLRADGIFTYSDWATDVLNKQTNNRIKSLGSASPCANLQEFFIVPNKKQHKQNYGLNPDWFVVGTVMRNQRRKLYPDLLASFRQFLDTIDKAVADKCFIYLHTCFPDAGWDIPRLIKENGLSTKTLMTYYCKNCKSVYSSLYNDSRCICKKCGYDFVTFPSSNVGVDTSNLCEIYNLFDVYVQYANSEGFGIPMVEAAACGLPIFATDFSAMSDVVQKLNGFPINVAGYYREPETHCRRAVPDNADFVKKLTEYVGYSDSEKRKRGFLTRMMLEKHFNWDVTAKKWEKAIENQTESLPWNSPPRYTLPTSQPIPENLTPEQFVNWGLINIAGRPDLLNSYISLRLSRDLFWGATFGISNLGSFSDMSHISNQERFQPFSKQNAIDIFNNMRETKNHWEFQRTGIPMV